MPYANEIYDLLKSNNIRVKLDKRDEKLSYKMRESQTNKIPYTLILGDNERDNNLISYRRLGSKDTITLSKDEFINQIKDEIINRK